MNVRYEGLQWKMDLPDALNAPISRIRLVSPHLPSIYFCAQSYRLHAAHTEALSAILTRGASFIKSADVAGRTPPAACRCCRFVRAPPLRGTQYFKEMMSEVPIRRPAGSGGKVDGARLKLRECFGLI